MLAGFT